MCSDCYFIPHRIGLSGFDPHEPTQPIVLRVSSGERAAHVPEAEQLGPG